jgi:hypothetical protein
MRPVGRPASSSAYPSTLCRWLAGAVIRPAPRKLVKIQLPAVSARSSQDRHSIVDLLRSAGVVDGQEAEVGGGAGEVVHCPVERGDVESGSRGGWSVEDDRALLVDPIGRRAAPGRATTAAVAVVDGDRETISRGLAQKKTLTAIAGELGRSVSTVSREVARNSGPNGATPPPCASRKGSQPTPCMAWLLPRSPGSSCTHADPRPHRQPRLPAGRRRRRPAQPHPARNRSTRSPPPSCWSRSWPATVRPGLPAPCSATSATRPLGSEMLQHAMSTRSIGPPKT